HLMNEVAAVFQFPSYFGLNWDALDECIQDLWWMKARAYLVIVSDLDKFLQNEESELGTFLSVIKSSAETWALAKGWPQYDFKVENGVGFHLILQYEENREGIFDDLDVIRGAPKLAAP